MGMLPREMLLQDKLDMLRDTSPPRQVFILTRLFLKKDYWVPVFGHASFFCFVRGFFQSQAVELEFSFELQGFDHSLLRLLIWLVTLRLHGF
ncbi:hypothetical protein LWI28_016354 [Acer negundo]|uniref:Uncharacterized protein n=1 Tax=Acer negundo TaxID=4023 RepID=A0AAD5IEN6_ACENE|nr:hypothetical protein LWI28_016354 [Acer negundo]KAK4838005.1 hypothetical protein QYF36_010302 [Acer negundo]